MTDDREAVAREIAARRAELDEMAQRVGLYSGSGKVVPDNWGDVARSLKEKIADLETKLQAMKHDANRS